MDRVEQTRKVADVVKGERAIDQIEMCFWQFQCFQISLHISDRIVLSVVLRTFKHVFRQVVSDDGSRALLAGKAGKPSKSAAEISDVFAG
ncbi:hypothetical protein D3C86_1975530 [compost metagenome]